MTSAQEVVVRILSPFITSTFPFHHFTVPTTMRLCKKLGFQRLLDAVAHKAAEVHLGLSLGK